MQVVFVICQRILQLAGVDFELRTVAILRNRVFTSTDASKDGSFLMVQAEPFSEQKRRAGSDSLLTHMGKDDSCETESDTSLDANVFYDSFADGPGESGDMDELTPENTLQHSVSESVLFTKDSVSPAFLGSNEYEGSHKLNKPHQGPYQVDIDNNYTEIETARFSDSDEGITIAVKRNDDMAGQPLQTTTEKSSKKDRIKGTKGAGRRFNDDSLSKKSVKSQASILLGNSSSNQLQTADEEKQVNTGVSVSIDNENFVENIASCFSAKLNYTRISTMLEKYKVRIFISLFTLNFY